MAPRWRFYTEVGLNSPFVIPTQHATSDEDRTASVIVGDGILSTGPYAVLGLGYTFGN